MRAAITVPGTHTETNLKKTLLVFLFASFAAAQVQLGKNVQIGSGAGSITSGTYLHVPYYTTNPSGTTLGADSTATTDGAGNFAFGTVTTSATGSQSLTANNLGTSNNFNLVAAFLCPNVPTDPTNGACNIAIGSSVALADGLTANFGWLNRGTSTTNRGYLGFGTSGIEQYAFEWDINGATYLPQLPNQTSLGTDSSGKIVAGSAGSGSVSGQAAGVIPLGTSATVIGNQSHLDDGVTAAGKITSSEPLVAPSVATGTPSAGVLSALPTGAHGFACDESVTAGVPALGVDYIRCDGTTHQLVVSQNNGAETPLLSGTGLSGMTAGQVPIAASASTVTSSKALSGAGAGITTGPTSSTSGDIATFTGTAGQLQDGGTFASNIPSQYKTWSCQPGLGDGLNAIAAGTYLESTCMNTTGVTVTLTGLKCFTDNAGTSTMNAAGNTLGALLTGAVTCSTSFAAGTQSANVALTNGDYIKFTFVADGTSKQTTFVVTGTY